MLQLCQLIDYLDTTILIEQKLINPVLEIFTKENSPLALPPRMRVNAYKILTDEAYHSQVAAELKYDLERDLSMESLPPIFPPILKYLEYLEKEFRAEDFYFPQILSAAIFEVQVTDDLLQMNTTDIHPFVKQLLVNHIQDERRHRIYFSIIIKLLWDTCSSQQRELASWLLPTILYLCGESCGSYTAKRALESLSFSDDEIATIMDCYYKEDQMKRHIQNDSSSVLQLLQKSGYFAEQSVVEQLEKNGFSLQCENPSIDW